MHERSLAQLTTKWTEDGANLVWITTLPISIEIREGWDRYRTFLEDRVQVSRFKIPVQTNLLEDTLPK